MVKWLNACRGGGGVVDGLQDGQEVQLKRAGELGRRPEGNVDVAREHFRDVRTRDLHPPREGRLRKAQGLHPENQLPQKRRTYPVYRFHAV